VAGLPLSDGDPGQERALFSRPFVTLLAMQMCSGFAFSIFLLLPKYLASVLGAGPLAIGAVNAMFGLANVVAIPFLVAQIDRGGARATILMGNLILAASALGFAFVDSVGPAALLLRGMQGIAWTMTFNGGLTITTLIAPPGRLAQAMGVYGSANLITNALAPAATEPLMDSIGYRPVFAAAAVLALLGWALGRNFKEGTVGSGSTISGAPSPPSPTSTFRVLLADARIRRLAGVVLIAGMTLGILFTFHQPFALQLGMENVRGFFIGYTAGALLIRLGAGRLSDRLGHRRTTLLSLLCYAAITAGMSLLIPSRLWLFGAIFGVAHGLFLPAFMALAIAGQEIKARGRILALMNGSLVAGWAPIPLVGMLAEAVGYPGMFVAAGIVTLSAMLLVPRERVTR
jgi:MFS family permease